jgi:hypothetical protein
MIGIGLAPIIGLFSFAARIGWILAEVVVK